MAGDSREDPLAYGEYHERPQTGDEEGEYEGGERGLIGDTYRKLRGKYSGQGPSGRPPNGGPGQPSGLVSGLFNTLHGAVHEIGSEVRQRVSGKERPSSHTHSDAHCDHGMHNNSQNRYGSFAAQRNGNDVKWFVDGCGYMWAVSRALEQARESVWILDWWLSPELYLRRPPVKNEQYRLDRMLQAAAQRGVKVNIIVYKEVTQALTRKYLSPTVPRYLHSLLPRHTDRFSSALCSVGLAAAFASLEYVESENQLMDPVLPVCSSHTKHALENLHPNISVFRHPDHLPDAQTLQSSFISSLQNMSLSAKTAAGLPLDALKAVYGMNEDVILYWAHHEKLCIVDGKTAFMGGLDLCYGRWDLNQHPIADCHPSNIDDTVFPGQEYNNARVLDFQDVSHWQNNKLDRTVNSRMGWSDISVSLRGPVVEDLRAHFVERWNFIYNEKYDVRKDVRYSRLTFNQNGAGAYQQRPSFSTGPQGNPASTTYSQGSQPYQPYAQTQPSPQPSSSSQYQPYQPTATHHASENLPPGQYFPPPPASRGLDPDESKGSSRGLGSSYGGGGHHHHQRLAEEMEQVEGAVRGHFNDGVQRLGNSYEHHNHLHGGFQEAGIPCQIVRSCGKWSHGVPTEHSIQNAYIDVIQRSQHFIYIENQFFITATSDAHKPVKNKIGAAIVDRILRAARAGERYKVIIVIPAVPGFAGDLKDDASLGTRAIMEFQYNSINRGGHSIMELVANEGFDPTEYIRFYNLRNYDRINTSGLMRQAEQSSGVNFKAAQQQYNDAVELPADYVSHGDDGQNREFTMDRQSYTQYQQGCQGMSQRPGLISGRWDTVSECYMLGGADIRSVPWEDGAVSEIDAFVSEELYVHSKASLRSWYRHGVWLTDVQVLIADDRVVICGSANLNDRSQNGDHDSEIAIIVEDPTPIDSYMNERPWQGSKFAATLRRQLFRKHLGLLRPQDMERPNANFEPIGVPNMYDFGSEEDRLVMDPLSDSFLNLWNSRAHQNTYAFGRIFHPVPHDDVRTWKDYDAFYECFFKDGNKKSASPDEREMSAKYKWGHVVGENFSPGQQGVTEMKELLSTIKGTLVEMPLLFLIKEDIAKEGVGLNAFTEEVYT
ncbi:MAG: hypothetical protein LQ338_002626 [Usnochroma carphineum]|nr:MAG: hypothetical protein LQ338_002626 [Usnochroma carphineum]